MGLKKTVEGNIGPFQFECRTRVSESVCSIGVRQSCDTPVSNLRRNVCATPIDELKPETAYEAYLQLTLCQYLDIGWQRDKLKQYWKGCFSTQIKEGETPKISTRETCP